MSNESLADIKKQNNIILKVTEQLEKYLDIKIDKNSLNYARLCTHLRFMIERTVKDEKLVFPEGVIKIVYDNYPQSYSLAWKLVRVVQNSLNKKISNDEVVCLAMHLIRFESNIKL